MYIFIGGIPASGKTYLARKLAEKTGAFHFDLDTLRKKMAKDPKLEYWVNFFWNQDEEKYLEETSCERHWKNLVAQSEAFWPTILSKVREVMSFHESAVFEGVNILPHLAKKDFSFPGIFLLGESPEQIFERNKQNPRWGQTEELQRQEAELFFNCDRPKYKEEAEKYGYKIFTNSEEAEKELIRLLNFQKIVIRLAEIVDSEALGKIHTETWQFAYRGIIPDEYLENLSIERRVQRWKEILSKPESDKWTLVAELSRQTVGFCSIGKSRDEDADSKTGELYSIYIDQNYMNQGIGTVLMQEGMKILKEKGYEKVTLWVLEENNKSRKFYDSKGWGTDGKKKTELSKGIELHEIRYLIKL